MSADKNYSGFGARNGTEDSSRPGHVGDTLRRILGQGVSAMLMTEEGIRGAISDMRLPKEVIASLVSQTERSRRELVRLASDELKDFLLGLDLESVIRKSLVGLEFDIQAKVRIRADGVEVDTEINSSDRSETAAPEEEEDVDEQTLANPVDEDEVAKVDIAHDNETE